MKVAVVAPIEEILANPRYFPARVDFERAELTFVETSRKRLSNTPFLDGRTPFAEGVALKTSLIEAIDARWTVPQRADRFIFHVAFCGSTLLASLLDIEGRSFAEREPHVLVEAADAWSAHPPGLMRPALQLLRELLRRPWTEEETNICKPSNWVNSLIPNLTADPRSIKPLFVSASQREYLLALFRGGRERMVYVVRVTDHLLRHNQCGPQLWRDATEGVSDPLERAARIALVCLHVQLLMFQQAIARGPWARSQLTLKLTERDPIRACWLASEALALNLSEREIEVAVLDRAKRYAKNPRLAYDPERIAAENCRIEKDYRRILDRVQDWAALKGLEGVNTSCNA